MKLDSISPQAAAVYRLLLKSEALSAREIGSKLGVLPHAVYRSAKTLEKYGCVERSSNRPRQFKALPALEVAEGFVSAHREWFLKSFPNQKSPDNFALLKGNGLNVTFIHNREGLLQRGVEDQRLAQEEIDLIISGDEVPAEVMLENKNSIGRGVKIKILVQRLSEKNEDMHKNWQRLGIEVRATDSVEARIVIIDSQIVYLVSYNPDNYEEAVGVRFEYSPIARLMKGMFYQRWEEAESL